MRRFVQIVPIGILISLALVFAQTPDPRATRLQEIRAEILSIRDSSPALPDRARNRLTSALTRLQSAISAIPAITEPDSDPDPDPDPDPGPGPDPRPDPQPDPNDDGLGMPPLDPRVVGYGQPGLNGCTDAIHDRWSVVGPDGRRYRTWHPNPDPEFGCFYGHEHGDPPPQAAPDFPFGYIAILDDPSTMEAVAHGGFKVFSHLRNQRSGIGSPEEIPVAPDWDQAILVHQGTAGAGRLMMPMHSFAYWTQHPDGRETYVTAMADTGVMVPKTGATPHGDPGPAESRVIPTHADHTYETWAFDVNIAGRWRSDSAFFAVTNGQTHLHAPDTLRYTSEEICGVNFTACSTLLAYGDRGSFWAGNLRTIHAARWVWSNAGGPEVFTTDTRGNPAPNGPIVQRVATIALSAGGDDWLRTTNAPGYSAHFDRYWGRIGMFGN